ncbi:MAG: 2-dehydropantoate 2-reductase [Ancrocorticia sp.]
MRILIVGAGGTGGSYGTLLHEAGRDVTFLVRAKRAEAIRANGLTFRTPAGERTNTVQTLVSGESTDPFDLVLFTVKATGLESAIEDIRPYIGAQTTIIPILNGMAHVARLEKEFPGQVLGGLVKIVATLDNGVVWQMTDLISITLGTLDGSEFPAAIAEFFDVPGISLVVSDNVAAAMWEKWAFIASAGVITCLFRGPVGAIVEAGGREWIEEAIAETEAVAAAAGYPVPEKAHRFSVGMLAEPGSSFTSSLYRDLTAGFPHEGEHILGEMAVQARKFGVETPLLDLTLIQVRTGEIARERY